MENPSSFSSSASAERDKRKSCIGFENEPKALPDKEMNLAREAALEVIRNYSEEQAEKIFLQGLVPVTTPVKPKWEEILISKLDCDDEDYIYDYDDEYDYVIIRN